MDRKVKYMIVLSIIAFAFGAFIALSPALAASEEQIDLNTSEKPYRQDPINKLRILLYILRNSEPAEIQARVVALHGRILIVEVDGSLFNINVPRIWIANGEIVGIQDLFDGNPIGNGNTVTISSLKIQMTRDNHRVTAYFVYEIKYGEANAHAVLPFNIET
jgi:hypothetical protein